MLSKTITYRSYKNFTEDQFKEAIRSDCPYIEGGNLTSLQKFSNKPHMISQLRKAIMKRSQFKNKANKSGKAADKIAYNKTEKFNR